MSTFDPFDSKHKLVLVRRFRDKVAPAGLRLLTLKRTVSNPNRVTSLLAKERKRKEPQPAEKRITRFVSKIKKIKKEKQEG